MKLTKVFFGDKRLKDVCVGASRWDVFKYRAIRFMRRVFITAFILGAIYGSFQLGRETTSPVFVQAEDKSHEMLNEKIDKLKDEVIAQLRACESAGHSEDDGILIFDSNEKASIGTLQFQKNTVIHYYKVLYGKEITGKEAVMIALDDDKAGQLAKDIAFTTKNKIGKDWVNCNKKHSLDAKVDLIKSMEVL